MFGIMVSFGKNGIYSTLYLTEKTTFTNNIKSISQFPVTYYVFSHLGYSNNGEFSIVDTHRK